MVSLGGLPAGMGSFAMLPNPTPTYPDTYTNHYHHHCHLQGIHIFCWYNVVSRHEAKPYESEHLLYRDLCRCICTGTWQFSMVRTATTDTQTLTLMW